MFATRAVRATLRCANGGRCREMLCDARKFQIRWKTTPSWEELAQSAQIEQHMHRDPEKEFPLWTFVAAPVSAIVLVIAVISMSDVSGMLSDQRELRAGGWVCHHCLGVNKADEEFCRLCQRTKLEASGRP
mmetsp:Transcript_11188/g.21058  ORF Transcript_11188/g.21058 Transcript_11188/m.21058 type:complete len:131 (+) Transcript_11188:20-412(+)